ncbi:hypothetical protein [Aquibacillus salsiterrae]|uniref:Lipoprotein n=1 Tax=Aquibacillus salsiterrae TaxID=2950439 RepID=A0A9X4AG02_9BACI|nr:hypothetical protein [Aquibacillus salsiterrae]MDC3416770.1 hypothetical protein [Aquibacillus salsiterrae]
MYKLLMYVLVITASITIMACSSPSEEETIQAVEQIVTEKPSDIEPTITRDEISYYLPPTIEEVETAKNNIVLKTGENTIVLFYDRDLKETDEIYQKAKEKDKNPLLLTKFNEKPTGFVKVIAMPDNLYELTVGYGGVKASTVVEQDKLIKSATNLSEIIYSLTFN